MSRLLSGSGFAAATFAVVLISFTACSDDDPATTPAVDAGTDTGASNAPDTGAGEPVDAGADSNSEPVEAGADAEAGVDAQAPDGGCAALGGAYALTGTCSEATFAPPSVLCIRQKGCGLAGTDEYFRQTFTGTATASGFTATAEIPSHQDCSGSVTAGKVATLMCTAPAVSITCNATAAPITLKGATDTCCSVATQDCATGERCQPLGNSTDFLVKGCIPDRGTVAENGTCTRLSTDVADVGNDDCKKGFFCSNIGQADANTRACQKLCESTTDCAAGSSCYTFGLEGGICRPRCAIFAGGSEPACGTGATCRVVLSTPPAPETQRLLDTACLFTGVKTAGTACTFTDECVPGSECLGGTCRTYCDATHACTTGTCTAFGGARAPNLDATLGTCQ